MENEITKSVPVSKRMVWEAYKRVKANKGAAGIDEQTIDLFEENLSGNLYKLWNRMASGSYFPPAVRVVEIPKKSGGNRKLGIPKLLSYYLFTVCVRDVFGIANGQQNNRLFNIN